MNASFTPQTLNDRLSFIYKQSKSNGLTFSEACDLHRQINRALSSLRSGGRKRTRKSDRAALRAIRASLAKRYRFPKRNR